jgi:hypothetical protein
MKRLTKTLSIMALLMAFEITFAQAQLRGVERVEVESSTSLLADTCVITLPGQSLNRTFDLEKYVKRGDAVTVRLGYDDQLNTEFVGYVKTVKPNSPMQIECEDALYLTRREIASKVFKNTTAVDVAKYVVAQLNKDLPPLQQLTLKATATGFQFRTFSIHQATGFEVLEKLRSETGLAIFARGQEVNLHLQHGYNAGKTTIYDFERNVEESNDLEYVRADEAKVLVKVTGKDAKGKKIEATAGEKGGDVRIINRPTVSDVASLKKIATETLKASQYEGYRGGIRSWLQPYTERGYSAKVRDVTYPEREGNYYVTSVKVEFSANGGVRTVALGPKLSPPTPNGGVSTI